ncbi:MAG TPA: CocE/NonD family hydrolase [Terriglobales bacterium]|nr:CocE/NonD family hydrolase [Terriglobales bacterium]
MSETPLANHSSARAAQQRRYFWVLVALLFLFCLRVLGQILVAFFKVSFLPPMEEWFSGLLPYPELLTVQILIILLYSKICLDFARGLGFFVTPRMRLGTGLLIFGSLYLGVMILRYIMRMSLYPHERWTGGCIPIFFHWVLSSFILVLGIYHCRTTGPPIKPTVGKRILQGAAVVVALLSVSAWAIYQMTPSLLAHQLGFRRSQFAVRAQKGRLFTSDGIPLVADIYHPQHTAHTPTILIRIPLTRDFKNSFFSSMIGKMWAERGYTTVIQGTRGRFGSGGTFYPLLGERQDGIETLQWIAKQPWFDGHILTWGGSAFGHTQWAIADQTAPGPSALTVYFASTNFHDMFYPGGAFSLDSALSWAIRSHGARDQTDWPSANEVQQAANGFPLLDSDRRATGTDVTFFKDWVEHPDRDAFWVNIDGQDRLQSLKAPVLLMAGWYDPFLPTQLNDFTHIRQSGEPGVAGRSRLIIGPWTHASEVTFPDGTKAENFRLQSLAVSLPWFDENSGLATSPPSANSPIRLFVMGKSEWRTEQEWPLARTQYVPYFLSSGGTANSAAGDGTLNAIAPTAHEPADSFTYDPLHPVHTAGGAMIGGAAGIARQNDIETRQDVLVYTTPSLNQDVEVTGPISLILYVSTTAPSTDFTAKLVDVRQDGYAFNISEGIRRRSYQEAQSPSAAEKVYEIHIELWPTSMVFFKRHRIRLEISSSNFPRFDRNPNTGNMIASEVNVISAKQTVRHGSEYPSRLVLPIIPAR